ncbi:TraR/DksA family transcriptional regulator [uncultured Microbacterium sp.]|jgi:RNA polymerase-binding transcription factor DksA|uniref:TraR/DksA family transcriptional regulator n=1 Tax=uncultured Microbacterium sp. TaxID=191216 RepID=UPI0028D01B59|nr:TraR/DksA family transcriptional regulator [uncultured Microbacterium sp.]
MTHTSHTVQDPNVDTTRQLLEQQLEERLDILAELAPRALPSVDPVAYQTAASNRVVVEQITAALNRLSAGTYGRCTRCGGQIAPARLEVLPHAAACIECQSHADAA